jgi:hypothetical protein
MYQLPISYVQPQGMDLHPKPKTPLRLASQNFNEVNWT